MTDVTRRAVPERFSVADEIVKLVQLRDAGSLTVDEFQAEKARVLLVIQATSAPLGGTETSPQPVDVAVLAKTVSDTKAGAWITLAGGAVLAVSGFLPWFTASAFTLSVSRNGMQLGQDGGFSIDGLLMLVFGLVVLLIGVGRLTGFAMPRYLQRSPVVVGVVATIIAGLDIQSINHMVKEVRAGSSVVAVAAVGFGVFVAIAGGLISVVGGVVLRNAGTSAPASRAPTTPLMTVPTSRHDSRTDPTVGEGPSRGTRAGGCAYYDNHWGWRTACRVAVVGMDGRSRWSCEEHHRGVWMHKDDQ